MLQTSYLKLLGMMDGITTRLIRNGAEQVSDLFLVHSTRKACLCDRCIGMDLLANWEETEDGDYDSATICCVLLCYVCRIISRFVLLLFIYLFVCLSACSCVDMPLSRQAYPAYADGSYQPSGAGRPNPHDVATACMAGPKGLKSFRNRTALLTFFGK